jgi:DNA mismatch endonuclease (patch repair protein)
MTDVFTRKERSRVMAAIKGKGNRSTELKLRSLLRSSGIKGWRSHLTNLPGKPDFAFPKKKVAIFVDGCFWHGCKRCRRNMRPSSNRSYWIRKIAGNVARDKKETRALRAMGWLPLRIWEHQLQGFPMRCLKSIQDTLANKALTH